MGNEITLISPLIGDVKKEKKKQLQIPQSILIG